MLKKMNDFQREDYVYESPDGDHWDITIVKTGDRKYVELKNAATEVELRWDVEMLLDIADAVRQATSKPREGAKAHNLKKPVVQDVRGIETVAADVAVDPVVPQTQEQIQADIEARLMRGKPMRTPPVPGSDTAIRRRR
jgi:hypothetical protein